MPAYDFRCRSCAHVFEIVRRAHDTSPVSCPVCEAAAKRVFTPVGVVFKGSGFHNTDYRTPPAESGTKESDSSAQTKDASAGTCAKKSGDKDCSGCPAAS